MVNSIARVHHCVRATSLADKEPSPPATTGNRKYCIPGKPGSASADHCLLMCGCQFPSWPDYIDEASPGNTPKRAGWNSRSRWLPPALRGMIEPMQTTLFRAAGNVALGEGELKQGTSGHLHDQTKEPPWARGDWLASPHPAVGAARSAGWELHRTWRSRRLLAVPSGTEGISIISRHGGPFADDGSPLRGSLMPSTSPLQSSPGKRGGKHNYMLPLGTQL